MQEPYQQAEVQAAVDAALLQAEINKREGLERLQAELQQLLETERRAKEEEEKARANQEKLLEEKRKRTEEMERLRLEQEQRLEDEMRMREDLEEQRKQKEKMLEEVSWTLNNRELKQRRRQRQRKRHPKIYFSFICATSRLFQLAQLLQNWRTIQEPNW